MLQIQCKECGEQALLEDAGPGKDGGRFRSVFVCPQGHETLRTQGQGTQEQLALLKRLNAKLASLDKPKQSGDDWFLHKVLALIRQKHWDAIYMGRYIMKHRLYLEFSQWFHLTRQETQHVLSMLADRVPGVRFSNRGLWLDKKVLAGSKDGDSEREEPPTAREHAEVAA